jgi:hypothetical protein
MIAVPLASAIVASVSNLPGITVPRQFSPGACSFVRIAPPLIVVVIEKAIVVVVGLDAQLDHQRQCGCHDPFGPSVRGRYDASGE